MYYGLMRPLYLIRVVVEVPRRESRATDCRLLAPHRVRCRQIVFRLGSATWLLATVAILLRWAPIAAVASARTIGRIPHAMCITTRTTRGPA